MEHELTPEERRRKRETELDEALAQTFPASDPVSTVRSPVSDSSSSDEAVVPEKPPLSEAP